MRRRSLICSMTLIAACAIWAACGGGGGGGGDDGGTGTASVKSLSSIPTIDLSSYDSSTSSNANLAALLSKSAGLSKGFGEGMRDEGGSSRAGCEANMHKQEIFRMSQQVQLDRCYPEAMETAGIITIPEGSYAFYKFVKGAESEEDRAKMCEGIPQEREAERAKCLEGGEGPSGGSMKLRIGRFDNELRIDMCQGVEDAEALVNEATYTANGSVYTAGVTRIGQWNGNTEKGNFNVTVDIGAAGSVTNGLVTLGEDGLVNAQGQMEGGFGSGSIQFERLGSDSSNIIKGAFRGGFTDPYSGFESSFTGRTYSHFGGSSATGCAKFSFTGSMPGMKVADMIPYDIPQEQREQFLAAFGAELGISLTTANYTSIILCPNPAFDPGNLDDPTIKPMTVASGQTCPEVTHTGTECFGISNISQTGNFGTSYTQVFTIIANNQSTYYDDVSGFDISTLSPSISEIAFVRGWNCTGTFTEIGPASFTPAVFEAMEAGMQACHAIEEKARANEGMGGYACGKDEQMNGVNKFAEGGGGQNSFGPFGGRLVYNSDHENNDCPEQAQASIPDEIFVNVINVDQRRYCFPTQGTCREFTVDQAQEAELSPPLAWGSAYLAMIGYDGETPTIAEIDLSANADGSNSCTAVYNIDRPEFEFQGGPGGENRGPGGMPQACIDAGLTTPEACQQLCMKPSDPCGFK